MAPSVLAEEGPFGDGGLDSHMQTVMVLAAGSKSFYHTHRRWPKTESEFSRYLDEIGSTLDKDQVHSLSFHARANGTIDVRFHLVEVDRQDRVHSAPFQINLDSSVGPESLSRIRLTPLPREAITPPKP
jgi:hypothetical protein